MRFYTTSQQMSKCRVRYPKTQSQLGAPIAKKKKFTQFQIEIKPYCVCVGVRVSFFFLFVCCSLNFSYNQNKKKKVSPIFFFFILSFIYTVLLPILYPIFLFLSSTTTFNVIPLLLL